MPQTKEKKKEKRKLAERRRMENIRKDPDKYALWKLKMKETKYLKRKRDGYDIHFDDLNYEKRRYNAAEAYSQSKLANVLFSRELAAKLKAHNIEGVNTYSLHPGVIRTELGRHMDEVLFKGARRLIGFVLYPFFKSPELGAQTTIYCAVDEKCANETGLYYSDCAVKNPDRKALNDEYAKKLWEKSVELVKLGDFDPFTAAPSSVASK